MSIFPQHSVCERCTSIDGNWMLSIDGGVSLSIDGWFGMTIDFDIERVGRMWVSCCDLLLEISSSFNFPRPTTKADDREDLYKAYGVDHAVVLDLAEPILEILAELGLSLTQILPNFLSGTSRTLVPSLCLRAQVATSSRTSHIAMRSAANSFFFQDGSSIDRVIRLLSASSELGREYRSFRKLFDVRRDFWFDLDPSERPFELDFAEHSQEVLVTPSVQAQPSDRLTRQLVRRSSFRTSGSASRGLASGKSPLISIHDSDDEDASEERWYPISLSPGSEDKTVVATRKRRRSSKGALPGPSRPRFIPEGGGSC
ncbi:hypothetical protein F2Q70_00030064 [Brassica cretica]|uniref:Uncharacterized protein n=2 Tax=Brassica cretica TaxID=69181 RepID=A0A3N6PSX4_BRACR|nr:hypothetical protein F2Q70_00030064 [Brassica cretica]KAF3488760.1 hypothetical protein F2Q69_00053328 [Brassica cretica]KAF3595479.1 hypothetical protein DY000_02022373 [Brassica cretica]